MSEPQTHLLTTQPQATALPATAEVPDASAKGQDTLGISHEETGESFMNTNWTWLLLAAHAFGDFPLQNHWMQQKSKSTLVCFIHVAAYSLPFQALWFAGWLPLWAYWAIVIQHFLQDRFALHLKWMRFYHQTPPDLWPVGPLAMDQAWHISFLGLIAACLLV